MDICAEQDAVDIQNRLLDINKRYEGLKSKAHTKSRDLTDAKRKLTQEVFFTLFLCNICLLFVNICILFIVFFKKKKNILF